MSKVINYVIGVLLGIIILLGGALGIFLKPLFQADEMLAQIRVENVEKIADDTCYIVSLEVVPGNDESQRDALLKRETICGDFLGIGYEFTLPKKAFWLMKKPGIAITNLVAIERKRRDQTGNVPVGRYEFEFMEFLRESVAQFLEKTPMVENITYDTKHLLKKPRQGAIITYRLETFRQQVLVECVGCEE